VSQQNGPPWVPILPDPTPTAPAPMGIGRVLEVGTRILRRHWAVLLAASALFIGPGSLLSTASSAGFLDTFEDVFIDPATGLLETDAAITQSELDRLVDALIPVLGASLLAGVLATVGTLAFSAVVADDYHARVPRTGSILPRTVARVPSAVAFLLVTSLVIVGIGLAGVLAMTAAAVALPGSGSGGPGVFLALIAGVAAAGAIGYLTLRWLPAYPAMIEEDIGWRDTLRRSWYLSADNVLRLLAVFVIALLATAFLDYLLARSSASCCRARSRAASASTRRSRVRSRWRSRRSSSVRSRRCSWRSSTSTCARAATRPPARRRRAAPSRRRTAPGARPVPAARWA
jgi:hypothetical protein